MYKTRNDRVAVVIPCYNEEKLVTKTIETLPDSVNIIIAVNDGSTDSTWQVLKSLQKTNKRLVPLNNDKNRGVGFSLKHGFKHALEHTDADIIGVMAGDAQCDPNYINGMLESLTDNKLDYIKANRFYHHDALKSMPVYRQLGNVFISLLTKFSTGYYSISDTQNGYGFFTRDIMKKMNFDFIGDRYDYENSMLIALSIAGGKAKDYPVPAIYGDEVSTIKFLPTALRALRAVWVGFWRRIYYKYILYSFHPIGLFLITGITLFLFGSLVGLIVLFEKLHNGYSPTTGTVMLVGLPVILGIQLLLTSITMDMNEEGKN